MMTQKKILYVDDDADDREILTEAIKDADPQVDVVLAENGQEALDYLNSIKDKEAKLPCLIVLDLNMPFLDGKETFIKIKQDLSLKKVPIIVYTSSSKPLDAEFFSGYNAEFITKPIDFVVIKQIANRMVHKCN